MTTAAQPLFGLTSRQIDAIREDRLSRRRPLGVGDQPDGLNLRVVEVLEASPRANEAGTGHLWMGRLVDFVDGVPVPGERVWVRSQIQQGLSYLGGERLTCRWYAAIFSEASATGAGRPYYLDNSQTAVIAPVYSVLSAEMPRLARITDVTTTVSPAAIVYWWVEVYVDSQRASPAHEGPGPGADGFMHGGMRPAATVAGNVLTFRPTTTGSTITVTATVSGVTATASSFDYDSNFATMASALQTLLNAGPGSGYTVVGDGTAGTLTVTNSGGTPTLTADPALQTPSITVYPARNQYTAADSDPILLRKAIGQTVILREAGGSYPRVVINQTSFGRNRPGDTEDDRSRAAFDISFESWGIGSQVCLTLWKTATDEANGESVDIVFSPTGAGGGPPLGSALPAAALAAGFDATFAFTAGGADGGVYPPIHVEVTDSYDDYGLIWKQDGAEGWGDKEFHFYLPLTYAPLLLEPQRDGSATRIAPTDYTPATDISTRPDVFFVGRGASGEGLQYVRTVDAGLPSPSVDAMLLRRAPIGSSDDANPRYVWVGMPATRYSGTIFFMKPDSSTGTITVDNGWITAIT